MVTTVDSNTLFRWMDTPAAADWSVGLGEELACVSFIELVVSLIKHYTSMSPLIATPQNFSLSTE